MYTLYSFAPNANKSVDEKPKHDERYRKESKKLEQVYIVWLYSHKHMHTHGFGGDTAHIYSNKFTGYVRNYICNSFSLVIIAGFRERSQKKVLAMQWITK